MVKSTKQDPKKPKKIVQYYYPMYNDTANEKQIKQYKQFLSDINYLAAAPIQLKGLDKKILDQLQMQKYSISDFCTYYRIFLMKFLQRNQKKWSKKDKALLLYSTVRYIQHNSEKSIQDLNKYDYQKLSEIVGLKAQIVIQQISQIICLKTAKFPFSSEEKDVLLKLIKKYEGKSIPWNQVAQTFNSSFKDFKCLRTVKSLKQLYNNHLNPALSKEAWTEEENVQLINEIKIQGKKWKKVANSIQTRNQSQVKNQYNKLLREEIHRQRLCLNKQLSFEQELNVLRNYQIHVKQLCEKSNKDTSQLHYTINNNQVEIRITLKKQNQKYQYYSEEQEQNIDFDHNDIYQETSSDDESESNHENDISNNFNYNCQDQCQCNYEYDCTANNNYKNRNYSNNPQQDLQVKEEEESDFDDQQNSISFNKDFNQEQGQPMELQFDRNNIDIDQNNNIDTINKEYSNEQQYNEAYQETQENSENIIEYQQHNLPIQKSEQQIVSSLDDYISTNSENEQFPFEKDGFSGIDFDNEQQNNEFLSQFNSQPQNQSEQQNGAIFFEQTLEFQQKQQQFEQQQFGFENFSQANEEDKLFF